MQNSALSAVMPLDKYQADRIEVFPSGPSLDWYVRCHKPALIEAGALLLIRNQWHAHVDKFDCEVLRIGAKDAQRLL